jgi:hypothetical protein
MVELFTSSSKRRSSASNIVAHDNPPCSLGLGPLGGEFGAALPFGFGLVDHAAHALDLPALPKRERLLDRRALLHALLPVHDRRCDLLSRINATKWPEREMVTDASQGVQLARNHLVCCDRLLGEADPVPESAAATAAGEQSKTNSPKINRRRRGSDSRAPLARARVCATMCNAPPTAADSVQRRRADRSIVRPEPQSRKRNGEVGHPPRRRPAGPSGSLC